MPLGAPERAPFSRRALLGTLAALPLATCEQPAPAALIQAGQQQDAGLQALQAKIANHKRLMTEWLAYYDNVYWPMENAHTDGLKAIPHVRGTLTYTSAMGPGQTYSTAEYDVQMARLVIEDANYCHPSQVAAAHEIIALSATRDAEIAALDMRMNAVAIRATENELDNRYIAAAKVVMAHPSTTTAELLAKLAFVVAEHWWDMDGTEASVTADVERLAMGRTH